MKNYNKISIDSFKLYAKGESRPSREGLNQYAIRNNLENTKICSGCGISNLHKTDGKVVEIRHQIHHVNGNKDDERFSNRRVLCALCHIATDNYAGGNRNKVKSSQTA